jgi:SRSO17 transposase
MKLYLPKEWIKDRKRRKNAGIPKTVKFREKWRLALDIIDNANEFNVKHSAIAADAGYGSTKEFRSELRVREEPYVLGVGPDNITMVPIETKFLKPEEFPRSDNRGRPRTRCLLPPGISGKNAIEMAKDIPDKEWTNICWSEGTKGNLHGKFFMQEVRIVEHNNAWTDETGWILLEQNEGKLRAYLCWGFEKTTLDLLVKIAKTRYFIELYYREMKDELGLDHFEGRSWNGWHHHTVLTQIAYAYLAYCRYQDQNDGTGEPLASLPEVRRQVIKIIADELALKYLGADPGPKRDKTVKQFSDLIVKMA